ncbi:MAG: UDP-glucose 6-dehydrogenase [Candidatus Diapherotrites archaeon CG10_big_fil_rev_8_21_14_0_10_31_34]|nr:MAG: UDP-glucose 6-dehydrogenase [Candidatus Diapherotrites archaeon CG10_big_fil_rev_8_21_14_0_10_31_34]PJA19633.1 MAG: UDP-glucose 6-dehydrogenase [Candidatus Diapherotrites archaeon CG_4_10_14_0_2_um_filter_31_5]
MNISVIGTGYVGLITGVGLALNGHKVVCVDNNKEKVEMINNKIPPIFEKGLREALNKTVGINLFASTDLKKAVSDSAVSFICVGTPCDEKGKCDLSFVETVSKEIAFALKEKTDFHVVVVKSTVVPSTTEKLVLPLLEKHSGKNLGEFGLCMNPETLREGFALEDFLNPDRIILGLEEEKTKKIMEEVYSSFSSPKFFCGFSEAEMIKYASNSLLATKISFINEVGNICKRMGIDTYIVSKGVGLDKRISPNFLNAGIGFGGSCFPKDVSALIAKGNELGIETFLLDSVMQVNELQPKVFLDLIKSRTELKGKKVAVLGLAFKAGTDDVRESRSIPVIKLLLKERAEVIAHDPQAEENMKKEIPEISYNNSPQNTVDLSDIVLILTDWNEFSSLDFKEKPVFDARNIFKEIKPLNYEGLSW